MQAVRLINSYARHYMSLKGLPTRSLGKRYGGHDPDRQAPNKHRPPTGENERIDDIQFYVGSRSRRKV